MKIPKNGVMKFEADSCPQCKIMDRMIEPIKKEMNLILINCDKDKLTPEYFGVMALPTFVFIKDEKEVYRQSGIINTADFKKLIKKYL